MANESEFDSNVKFKGGEGGVTVGLRRNNVPWWIVLLLLPLLLLIKCNKEITVTCTDCENGSVVSGQPVTLEYTPRFIYDDGKFFPDSTVVRTVATDDNGTSVFDSLRCSVFSYIFYCLSEVKISAENECYTGGAVRNFHFTRHVDICLDPKRIDLHIKIIDAEKGYVLPDAELKYTYIKDGEPVTETVKADAAGEVTIPGMRFCSSLQLLEASCYGYENCVKRDEPCQNHAVADDFSAMRLKPVKKRVEFFVKDKDTKQPIPAAEAIVTFTLPDGSKDVQKVHTSVDGRGIAFCDDIFMLAEITSIHAHKDGFGDGDLQGVPWRVDKFIEQDENTRTIWLERLPIAVEFRNVDKLNSKPIAGVTNKITVIAPDGTKSEYTEISNRNGVFVVRAKPGSKIEINATKNPDYKPAHHVVGSFQNKGEDVLMDPVMVTLTFRTINEADSKLLPSCNLVIRGTISGTLAPNNSGSGVFEVTFRISERISITASKPKYGSNSTKVNNNSYTELNVSTPSRRDIPLKKIETEPEPPRRECGVHFSGYFLSDQKGNPAGDFVVIFQPDPFGEYVGNGEYPDNTKAFPKAVNSTFDAIAVDKGTRLILYRGKNFSGGVVLDVKGPILIENVSVKTDSRYAKVMTKTFTPALQALFPPSRRQWSSENMKEWSYGSCKIICE